MRAVGTLTACMSSRLDQVSKVTIWLLACWFVFLWSEPKLWVSYRTSNKTVHSTSYSVLLKILPYNGKLWISYHTGYKIGHSTTYFVQLKILPNTEYSGIPAHLGLFSDTGRCNEGFFFLFSPVLNTNGFFYNYF